MPDTFPLDPRDPEAAIAAAAKRCSNWGRWGADDVHGTLNFLDDAKRREGAALIRRGASFSLAQSFDANGPQKGWRRRTNPVHTMLDTGVDAERGNQGFPHGHRRRGRRDLHAAAGLDPMGRPWAHLRPRQRLERSPRRRCGDQRGRPGDRHPDRDGPDQRPRRAARRRPRDRRGRRTSGRLRHHHRASGGDDPAQGPSATVGRGDLLLVRTGRLARARRDGWGDYAGGASPGLSFTTADWLHGSEIAGIATDTWGFEVRPNEFDIAFQPLHQVAIPHIGLFIGEMWDLDALAADCAADGVYDFWLSAEPLPVTGAVGSPVAPVAIK